jgi:hypothetical protein
VCSSDLKNMRPVPLPGLQPGSGTGRMFFFQHQV